MRIERPSRKFTDLSWEVTLSPGQYVVVGCRPEKTASFGQSAFVQDDTALPLQRLLVIRTNRATAPDNDLAADGKRAAGPSPPLCRASGDDDRPNQGSIIVGHVFQRLSNLVYV